MTAHALGDGQDPLEVVNEHLNIGAVVTFRGDEIKCWTPDGTGELRKNYLSADDCAALAKAFGVLASTLAPPPIGGAT